MNAPAGTIVLSAGGTGGHMTPAAALASDLAARGFRVDIVTDRRGMKFKDMFPGMKMRLVPSGALTRGVTGKIIALAALAAGTVKAGGLLMRLKPVIVIGFGGYPSVPGVFAAQILRIPTIIHEQNAVMGLANKLLAPRADCVALSWENTKANRGARIVITGNPVRPEIAALRAKPYPGLDRELRIFIMGGSLGAKVFSEVVPQALSRLSPDDRRRVEVVQQCRAEDIESVRAIYERAGIKADLAAFFGDVAAKLSMTHLVIGRSGASTVAEITAAGRPAIFVPYPHHKDQQQKINADFVANAGGAWVMEESGFTPEALLARVEAFLHDPAILARAAEKARSCGRADAARRLGDLVAGMVSLREK